MDDFPTTDLERRKFVRVRLRPDLSYTVQKYEGRTYYVYKDPVSLRYYRFKEQERFLLDLMDGETTLDEAQKAFENRFRPERLTLENLESFATQLLNAGLAQNESPQAGKQLFKRHKKRKKTTFISSSLNILYIKIPLYDPDRVLTWMLPRMKFIFTLWFLFLSLGVMLGAGALILMQWDTFYNKLPSAQEFFSFNTLIYLWAALGVVKIIHEFGHGLSCKAFGGEVHEMGFLFLVFSPCLYCNVSDSWTLPSKWKRIIIGAAGIYVELMIASLATFLWWATDSGSFVNNLCMSLMIVCSVSTVIFNGNPLMRFDGYYIMSDWLEIPNLRDRSNKFVLKLFQEFCLGIETQPEPYMTRSRQILFITYAIAAYLYRWLITFTILYFMYTFLKPYKLGAISFLLGTAALGTMFGFPLFKLIKSLKKRGRIPDMKPRRVWLTLAVVTAAIAVLLMIPFPVRITALAVIQVKPDYSGQVTVPMTGGFLQELHVKSGRRVNENDLLATLILPQLDVDRQVNHKQQKLQEDVIYNLDRMGLNEARTQLVAARSELDNLRVQLDDMNVKQARLKLRAPCDGIVLALPSKDDRGRWLEPNTPFASVGDPRGLRAMMLVETSDRELAATGDTAWIRVHGRGYNYWPGTVSEIDTSEAQSIPQQFSNKVGGEIPTNEDPDTGAITPEYQHYAIYVDFEELDEAIQPGAMARVKIVAEPRTLWWRFRRYMSTAFNWELWF